MWIGSGALRPQVAAEVGPEPAQIALDLFEHWKKPRIVC